MATARIEDDTDQLKVHADDIPPVRAAAVDAVVETGPPRATTLPTTTTTTATTPKHNPALVFRALHSTGKQKP